MAALVLRDGTWIEVRQATPEELTRLRPRVARHLGAIMASDDVIAHAAAKLHLASLLAPYATGVSAAHLAQAFLAGMGDVSMVLMRIIGDEHTTHPPTRAA